MTDPVILAPAQGETVTARGSVITLKATAATTDGHFSFMERTLPPGGRVPPSHTHDGEEVFYVLAGRVTVQVGDRTVPAGPGTFVLVPPQVPHTFGNDDQAEARLLLLHHPAADAYFRDLAALWAAPVPPLRDAERALMRRHGITAAPTTTNEGYFGFWRRSLAIGSRPIVGVRQAGEVSNVQSCSPARRTRYGPDRR